MARSRSASLAWRPTGARTQQSHPSGCPTRIPGRYGLRLEPISVRADLSSSSLSERPDRQVWHRILALGPYRMTSSPGRCPVVPLPSGTDPSASERVPRHPRGAWVQIYVPTPPKGCWCRPNTSQGPSETQTVPTGQLRQHHGATGRDTAPPPGGTKVFSGNVWRLPSSSSRLVYAPRSLDGLPRGASPLVEAHIGRYVVSPGRWAFLIAQSCRSGAMSYMVRAGPGREEVPISYTDG